MILDQEVCDLDRFVRDTALQEATAKIRLQHFIEDLLGRAERAETQLQNLHDDVTSPHRHLAGSRTSGYQSLILHNLKPRSRGKEESKDEYLRNTRGGLEAGLEAVLKSGGRSLVTLSVSHCPNILTDRSLWLVSCHCRTLQSLTYR
ncbi:hypothetical protein cypCar_00033787 [Cyprinus carpio]|nr:hypothetical protein cypCar_00033787 [Cyprinus carpio]